MTRDEALITMRSGRKITHPKLDFKGILYLHQGKNNFIYVTKKNFYQFELDGFWILEKQFDDQLTIYKKLVRKQIEAWAIYHPGKTILCHTKPKNVSFSAKLVRLTGETEVEEEE